MALKYLELAMTDAVHRAQTQYYGRAVHIPGAPERDPLGHDEAEFIACLLYTSIAGYFMLSSNR